MLELFSPLFHLTSRTTVIRFPKRSGTNNFETDSFWPMQWMKHIPNFENGVFSKVYTTVFEIVIPSKRPFYKLLIRIWLVHFIDSFFHEFSSTIVLLILISLSAILKSILCRLRLLSQFLWCVLKPYSNLVLVVLTTVAYY